MAAVTETIVIHLPEAVGRRLRRVAEIAHRPVDEVAADTISAGLPALLEDVPLQFQAELAQLEPLTTEALWREMRAVMEPAQVARYDQVLAAKADGSLGEVGQAELEQLRQMADSLMFRKAYAALLLRWRGGRLPTLTELETATP